MEEENVEEAKVEDLKVNPLERPYVSTCEHIPLAWEPEHLGKRIVKAFVTLDRLPRVRGPRQPGGHWPRHVVEWADQLAQADLTDSERRERDRVQNRVILRPTSAEIAQMEAVFDWLRELRAVDSGMAVVISLWGLRAARGRSVKALCIEKQWAPHTFYRTRAKALAHLADWLNRQTVPVF